jgi:phenylacetate-CoA ligase
MPLIRVPVGDIARIERAPCPCGQESQRISYIRGRIDEMFMLGGYNFYPDFICKAFEGVPGITGDFQGVVSRRGMRDLLTMTFELAGGQEAAVRAAIQDGLRSLAPDLWKCFEEGLADLVVEFAAPGTIRTGRKLKRFVDQRGN